MAIDSISGLNQSVLTGPQARQSKASSDEGRNTQTRTRSSDQVSDRAASGASNGATSINLDAKTSLDGSQALELALSLSDDLAKASIQTALAVHGSQKGENLRSLLAE